MFDFEQTIRKTLTQLRKDLARYKAYYSSKFKTINEDKQKPVELYQIRQLLTYPKEYLLIFHIEDTGLTHAIPLTTFTSLTTSNLRLHIRDLTLAPLPYYVYIVKEALEKISIPIALLKASTVERVIADVETTPVVSHIRPVDEFIKLVWKRYEQLTIASLLYNTIKQEEGLDN